MSQTTDYSILFLDCNQQHSLLLADEPGIQFFQSRGALTTFLDQHQDIHYAVCVCCRDQEAVGNALQVINNVISVSLCLDHNEEAGVRRRHFLHEAPHQWQLDLHGQALNVNQPSLRTTIFSLIERIIRVPLHEPHPPAPWIELNIKFSI